MIDDTVECVSVEGTAAVIADEGRIEQWAARYIAKYRSLSPDLTADFVRQSLVVEFVPERAFAIIEREAEFATRATRWIFEP
jgi:hypothetical protein